MIAPGGGRSGGPPLTLGIDIGGTKIAAGVVTSAGVLLDVLRADTPSRLGAAREAEDLIVELAFALAVRHEIAAVGIAAAGFVDADRAAVVFAPHLAWRDEPLRDVLRARLGVPVVVENDANAAAWAEWRFGSGRGRPDLICVALGTGIGGAMLTGGQLQRGAHGMAGEFGHMVVVPGGRPCECGNAGCWEQYASGNALVKAARGLPAREAAGLLERAGGESARITGHLVGAAALDGDPAAVGLVTDIGRWLGVGLANLAAALDPSTFVIGGGVSEIGDLLLDPAREAFAGQLPGRDFRPEAQILAAALGNTAGMVGAGDLARPMDPTDVHITAQPAQPAQPAPR